ncbi:hypothetical protein O6H91_05G045500 [Diphasiastrum complanatum]|uniref:Uncharacterized protein n=1 Tax=Diphasiastrum complanatum TaxID=34168 RepID=A0ACC2DN68_DIPCM|nr:hypothetical protein O6H91_05G045500 [Diphasiastrum complanatum]
MGILAKEEERLPRWIHPFLVGDYFSNCRNHSCKRNERNQFCIDCIQGPLCHIGLQGHIGHRTLQVRRASHMDAVRVSDVQKLADISSIQTYSINGAKIVFLLCRPQHKIVKDAPHSCITCGRSLADPVNFCCISCKLFGVSNRMDASATLCLQDTSCYGQHRHPAVDAAAVPVTPTPNIYCGPREGRLVIKAFAAYLKKLSNESSNSDQLHPTPLRNRMLEDTSDTEELHHALQYELAASERPPKSPISVLSPPTHPQRMSSYSIDAAGRLLGSTQLSSCSLDDPAGRFLASITHNIRNCEGFRERPRKDRKACWSWTFE